MDKDHFEKTVSERAGVPREAAGTRIRAVLRTLSERLTRGEANDLAAQLPKEIKNALADSSEPTADRFGADEFVSRVSHRAEVPPDEARKATEAVFSTVRDAVSEGEFRDAMSQLPAEYEELVR